jgi:uncharacterized membrane protein YgaE (UPF0421/DUF939 family)
VAANLLGHEMAFFAPIAAVIVLGASMGHRLRRGVELVAGVAVGIAVGDLLIAVVGSGPLQLALVVMLAVVLALFLGSGVLLVNQAAASAVLITTLFPPSSGIYYARWVDALVGGVIALVVHAILLPVEPLTVVHRSMQPILATLAESLVSVGAALRSGDLDSARALLTTLRETDPSVARFRDSLAGARELVAVSPIRFRARGALANYLVAGPHVDHAIRNSRVLARHVVTALRNAEPIPEAIPDALDELSSAVEWLGRELEHAEEPEAARGRAVSAIRLAYTAMNERPDLSMTAVAAQIRSVAFDVLLASGLDDAVARASSQHARRQATRPSEA